MALEVEFGIPGEVSFSYVHIKGTPEELGRVNYEMLGALFTSAMFSHKQAEKAAIQRIQNGETALLPASRVSDVQDVPEDAGRLLEEELGATEVGHRHHFEYGDDNKGHSGSFCECGMEEPAAPYKAAPPAAKKKPWESEKPLPQVTVDIDAW